jgi:hypothetical protein
MPALDSATCATLNDHFNRETGRLGLKTYQVGLHQDPVLALAQQDEWPAGMGTTIKTAVFQRTKPASAAAWAAVTTSGAESNACIPNREVLPRATDQFESTLYQVSVESDWLCFLDLLSATFPDQELDHYQRLFSDHVNLKWSQYFTEQYFAAAQHKVSVAAGLPEDTTDYPSTAPTSNLTMGVLKRARARLLRDGAGHNGYAMDSNNRPVFTLVASPETIDSLVKNNEDIRQDYRWSDRVSELLGPIGAFSAYGGFTFLERSFPRRFNDDGAGGYTEVPVYSTEAATIGTKAEVSAAYHNAKYEESMIWVDNVVKFLNPNPNVKIASGVSYNAQNYRGDMKWFNETDYHCNPYGDQGKWMARLITAPQPVMGRWGYTFLHLRCDAEVGLLECPAGSGYLSL